MPPKIIHSTNHEDYVPEKKSRSKPKPWTEPDWIKEYRLERDRLCYKRCIASGDIEGANQILAYYNKPLL